MRAMNFAIRLALIAASALLASPAAVRAQQSTAAAANIPFAFQVGGKQLHAGKYKMTLEGADILILSSRADSALMQVSWDISGHPSATGELVFHRYGDRYFLRQLRLRDRSEFLNSPQSKEERNAQKEQSVAEMRTDAGQNADVSVAVVAALK